MENIMNAERELLKLAAMACGWSIDTYYVDGGASVWLGERQNSDWIPSWNPRNDDGDALRLASRLKINLFLGDPGYVTAGRQGITGHRVACEGDDCAALRLAICMAAADIGRQQL